MYTTSLKLYLNRFPYCHLTSEETYLRCVKAVEELRMIKDGRKKLERIRLVKCGFSRQTKYWKLALAMLRQ